MRKLSEAKAQNGGTKICPVHAIVRAWKPTIRRSFGVGQRSRVNRD